MTYNIKGCKVRTLVADVIHKGLRQEWIVGMAGILDSLLLVSFCGLCTFLTTLSLSAIATNGALKGGGPYYLIGLAVYAGITGLSSTTFKDNLSSEFQRTNKAGVPDRWINCRSHPVSLPRMAAQISEPESQPSSTVTPQVQTSCRKKKSDDATFLQDIKEHLDEFMFGMSKVVAERNAEQNAAVKEVESLLPLKTSVAD
ncbi:hypothetical protein IFM89_007278 [Coptis chinensis]|uniref:Amino acid permease/ SLC12A domain-containing protein n=1 Tax=Coptis chinensis TaxID=261450 RepID=A0A835IKI3_9MAGN|nr:hypothetical protein IFM89_007278 [Coptis chinensis]